MMNRELIASLAWGGALIVLALGATLALKLGLIERDLVLRLVIGANGLMVAYYGNLMPKKFVPSAKARQALRVGGWAMTSSGLVYAALWAFAPIRVATFAGCAVLVAGIAITFAYCLALRAKAKAA